MAYKTIVDPKGSDWSKYNGATCITPNVKELGECVGHKLANDDATIVEAAKSVLANVDLEYIVATRSAKGITVIARMDAHGIIRLHNKRYSM